MTPAEAHWLYEFLLRHFREVWAAIAVIAAGLGAVIAAVAYTYNTWRSGSNKVAERVDRETDKLIDLLTEQNATLTATVEDLYQQVTNLSAKVSRLADIVLLISCESAPTCRFRCMPDRATIDGMIDGFIDRSEIVAHSVEINAAAGKLDESKLP